MIPCVQELLPVPDVEVCFQRVSRLPYCCWLDSARKHTKLGRYSFLMADPVQVQQFDSEIAEPANQQTCFRELQAWISQYESCAIPGLPPFQGGLAGYLSYDLAQELEELPRPPSDDLRWPAAVVGLYAVVIAWDHEQQRAWLIAHGWDQVGNESDTLARERMQRWLQLITATAERVDALLENWPLSIRQSAVHASQISVPNMAKSTHLSGVYSNFTRPEYLAAVAKIVEYIKAGDVFQVNLTQRLLAKQLESAVNLYLKLRVANPATFAGYFDLGDRQLLSASPERFLQVQERVVETRPIKGTRPRSHLPEADLFQGDELLASAKDRAENVMIVDLLRNDLSSVCEPNSVRVTELCRLEVYEYVQHLVSVVQGRLDPSAGIGDLLTATWPGGSITGAPKIRAQQIITELEQLARGPYCGSLFYWGADGQVDLNLLIRTILIQQGWCQFSVGGGITAASEPETEYAETWHKAKGLLRAIF
jgi:para-aminobenzoate synthetase component I